MTFNDYIDRWNYLVDQMDIAKNKIDKRNKELKKNPKETLRVEDLLNQILLLAIIKQLENYREIIREHYKTYDSSIYPELNTKYYKKAFGLTKKDLKECIKKR